MRRSSILASLALMVGWAVVFGPAAWSDLVPYHRDLLGTMIPIRAFVREQILAGSLPAWYPYEALGVPFLGQIVTAVWHPATWLLLPLDAVSAVKWHTLLAPAFALAGTYRASRRLGTTRTAAVTGAFAFAFGGYAFALTNDTPYLTAFATLPWVLEAALRLARRARARDAAFLALVTALVFLAGDAQSFATCPLLFAAALLIEGPTLAALGWFVVAGALSMGLAAIELLPALAIGADTIRALDFRQGEQWALSPIRLLEFLHPRFLPEGYARHVGADLFGDAPYTWATTIFAGSTTIALALASLRRADRRHHTLAALAILGVLLALGRHVGLLSILEMLVPPFARFRFPEKHLALTWVALAPLAALGVDAVSRLRRAWAVPAILATFGVFGGAATVVFEPAERLWAGAARAFPGDPPLAEVLDHAWAAGFVDAITALAIATLLFGLARRMPLAVLAIPVLLLVELRTANLPHLRLVDPAAITDPPVFAPYFATSGPTPPPRVSHRTTLDLDTLGHAHAPLVRAERATLQPLTSGLNHIPAFGSRLPGVPARAYRLLGPVTEPTADLAAFLNGCFVVTDLAGAGPPRLADDPAARLTLLAQPCRARAFLAGTLPVADPEAALEALAAGIPDDRVVWEGGPLRDRPEGQVEWLSWSPSHVELAATTDRPGALVLNDQYFPGWHAFVDDTEVPIHATTLVGRGVDLPAGSHRVSFVWETPRLRLGAGLSIVALILAAALLRRPRTGLRAS